MSKRVSAELEEIRVLHREMVILHREVVLQIGERLLNVEARERALASATVDDAAAGHA